MHEMELPVRQGYYWEGAIHKICVTLRWGMNTNVFIDVIMSRNFTLMLAYYWTRN